jgi:hypothetical protein
MKADDLSEYNMLEDSFLTSQKNKKASKPIKELNSTSGSGEGAKSKDLANKNNEKSPKVTPRHI